MKSGITDSVENIHPEPIVDVQYYAARPEQEFLQTHFRSWLGNHMKITSIPEYHRYWSTHSCCIPYSYALKTLRLRYQEKTLRKALRIRLSNPNWKEDLTNPSDIEGINPYLLKPEEILTFLRLFKGCQELTFKHSDFASCAAYGKH